MSTIPSNTTGPTGIVNNQAGSSGTGQTGSTMPSAGALQNEFLQLLTTQLQHQDPLQPMDGTQFTAQLAQFSQLEQLSNLNTSMGSLSNTTASNMIGKYVTTSSGDTAQVTGVSFQNNQTGLELSDNTTVSMSDITEVKNSQ